MITRYVRICPNGHENPDYDTRCGSCPEYIGDIEPQRKRDIPPIPGSREVSDNQPPATFVPEAKPQLDSSATLKPQISVTKRQEQGHQLLYLEMTITGVKFPVRPGQVIGQEHPTSVADVLLPNVPGTGTDYIHRRHCSFDVDGDQWYITPLDQRPFGSDFTNPTYVNGALVSPGARAVVRSGDRLTLVNVTFVINIF